MVAGSSAHWHPPRSQAFSRGPAPFLLAHPACKHAATLLAPNFDGEGGNSDAPAPRLPVAPAQQHLGNPLSMLRQGSVGGPVTTATLGTATGDASARISDAARTGSKFHADATLLSTRGYSPHPRVHSRNSPGPAALTSWIKSSRNISRLQRLVRQYGSQMNHINVSAALTHLSQLSVEDAATAAALSATATAVKHKTGVICTVPSGAVEGACPMSSSRDVSIPALHGVAVDVPSSASLPASVSGDMSETCTGTSSTAAAASPAASPPLSKSGDSYCTPYDGVRELLSSLLTLVHEQLPHFEPRQLANTAWALGKWPAGLAGRDDALTAVLQASAPLLPYFGAQELANLLHGWASCAASSRAFSSGGSAGPTFDRALSSAPSVLSSQLPGGQAHAQDQSQTLALESGPRFHPHVFLMGHSRACMSQLKRGSFKMQELSNLLWSWGVLLGAGGAVTGLVSEVEGSWSVETVLGDQDAPAAGALAIPYHELLAAQLQLGLASASPQELANSILSLARLQLLPAPEWFEAFLLASRRHLLADIDQEAVTAGNTANSGQPTREAVAGRPRIGFSPQELSNLLWGCSKLHLRLPPSYLDDVAPALERCLPLMILPERVSVLWALAWQAKLNAGDWRSLWDTLAEPQATAAAAVPRQKTQGPGREGMRTGARAAEQWEGEHDPTADAVREGRETEWPLTGGPGSGGHTAEMQRCQEGWVSRAPGRAAPGTRTADVVHLAGWGAGEGESRASNMGETRQSGQPLMAESQLGAVTTQGTSTTSGWQRSTPAAADVRNHPLDPAIVAPPSFQTPSSPLVLKVNPGSAAAVGCPGRAPGYPQPGKARAERDAPTVEAEPQEQCQTQTPLLHQPQLQTEVTRWVGPVVQHVGPATASADKAAPLVRRVVLSVLDPLQRTPGASAPQDISMALWSVATLSATRGGCRTPLEAAAGASPLLRVDDGFSNCNNDGGNYSGHDRSEGADGDAADGATLLAPPDADVLVQVWSRWLEDMSPQGQANCVWAAARLRLRLPHRLQGRLAVWLLHRAQDLSPAELAAVLRGLGLLSSQLQPSQELSRATVVLLDQAYLRYARYGLCELAQVCYGGALLLRLLRRPGGATGSLSPELDDLAPLQQIPLPAAAAIRMSMDLEDAGLSCSAVGMAAPWPGSATAAGGSGVSPGMAATTAVAAAAQQRRLLQPLDALVGRLQQAYQREEGQKGLTAANRAVDPSGGRDGVRVVPEIAPWDDLAPYSAPALGLEVLVMTLEAVALILPIHGSSVRGSELSAWCQDLIRVHVRSIVIEPGHHVRALAPLLHAVAASAMSSVRAARARKQAERERRRAVPTSRSAALPRSSMDEFTRSGWVAERREELMQLRQTPGKVEASQQLQQDLPGARLAQRLSVQQQQPAAMMVQSQAQQHESLQTSPAQPQRPKQQQLLPPGHSTQSATWAASGLSVDWLQRFWSASASSVGDATPKEAAMMLWAMSALAVQPPDPWVRTLLNAVEPYLCATITGGAGDYGVSDQTLGILLSSLGHLRVQPSPQWMAMALAAVDFRVGGGGDVRGHREQGDMNTAALLGVLSGLAYLEWPLPADWLARLVRTVAPQLGRLNPAERTRAYMAVASLDAALADRVGFEFSELLAVGRAGRGPAGGAEWERGEEGTAQQRTLFTRSRGGW
ncbi:hypothetical protein VaNZ11_004318 [Volvox africanus]|uniref:Uncharacterized protein n=1 Tax=Volvox africanus TaxID=51714 RepID=A0ABQ5RWL3_9CHLO|nr:hypothetical protein VaNZ11_004318 [Volvox africanus]